MPYNISTPIGGTRVKRIEKNNGYSTPEIITFHYEGGILMHDFTSFIPYWNGGNSIGESYVFDINSLVPLSSINGSHISYDTITEKYTDNSSTTYKYSNYNNFPDVAV
ncbi:MAG: hypothetical protein GKR88_14765 [Flavobacteriaceae bacterium]|nr:MAG: hypothetical protein GKR88_14765 [Flavobacteriaceae bacterium]